MSTNTSNDYNDGASKSSVIGVCEMNAMLQNMSTAGNINDKVLNICANCGKEGSDVNNTCNKCTSVMYCNAACKKKHRQKHKKQCERRVAELHDEKLFKQPPQLEEDCPICFMRLPTLGSGRTYMSCCGKVICSGCIHAFQSRITRKKEEVCPFCRISLPKLDEMIKRFEKRIDLNDARAIYSMGCCYAQGKYGLPRNRAKALELWHQAGELGSNESLNNIGIAYEFGRGVDVDMKKAVYYYELGAMGGHAFARTNLGLTEMKAGNMDRALKHYMIVVRDGSLESLENIKFCCFDGFATKDDYAKALCSYQAYLDEIKSDQRDEAAAAKDDYKYYESSAV